MNFYFARDMKIQEILNLEHENSNTCNLIKDGIFWRAYEQSAMLFVSHIRKYTTTKKHFKIVKGYVVYLGFPDSSLPKVLEIAGEKGFSINKNEKQISIGGFDEMDGFEKWKDEIPVYAIENKPQNLNEPEVGYGAIVEANNDLQNRIMRFPIAERTPMDCQKFIIELQNIINGTI
jgi:hypothetical protein